MNYLENFGIGLLFLTLASFECWVIGSLCTRVTRDYQSVPVTVGIGFLAQLIMIMLILAIHLIGFVVSRALGLD